MTRFRFRLVRPRAAAHMWGRGARILTEINRIPQFGPSFAERNPQNAAGNASPAAILGRASSASALLMLLLIRRSLDPIIDASIPPSVRQSSCSAGRRLCSCRSARSSSSFCCVSTASSAKSPRRSASAISARSSRWRRSSRPLLHCLDRAPPLPLASGGCVSASSASASSARCAGSSTTSIGSRRAPAQPAPAARANVPRCSNHAGCCSKRLRGHPPRLPCSGSVNRQRPQQNPLHFGQRCRSAPRCGPAASAPPAATPPAAPPSRSPASAPHRAQTGPAPASPESAGYAAAGSSSPSASAPRSAPETSAAPAQSGSPTAAAPRESPPIYASTPRSRI